MDRNVKMIVASESAALAAAELMMVHKKFSRKETAALVKVILDAQDGFRAAMALDAKNRVYTKRELQQLKLLRQKIGLSAESHLHLVRS